MLGFLAAKVAEEIASRATVESSAIFIIMSYFLLSANG
jgi:hypothetical protein